MSPAVFESLAKLGPSKMGVRLGRDYQKKHGDNKFPPFTEFVKFVTEIAKVHCQGFQQRRQEQKLQGRNSLVRGEITLLNQITLFECQCV